MAVRRKLNALKRKIELIDAVERNPEKRKEITDNFKIPVNTLSTIIKNKEKYCEQYYDHGMPVEKKRQRWA